MEIKQGFDCFYIGESKHLSKAIIEYVEKDCILYATRTHVDIEFRGQGIAKNLLDSLVSFARMKNMKIFPICSYVEKEFTRDEKYSDIKTIEGDLNGISANCRLHRKS